MKQKTLVLTTVGDIDPIAYDGGFVLQTPDGDVTLEYSQRYCEKCEASECFCDDRGLCDCKDSACEEDHGCESCGGRDKCDEEHACKCSCHAVSYSVFTVPIEGTARKAQDWADWDAVAKSCGYMPGDESDPDSSDPVQHARCLMDLAGYDGWLRLDQTPDKLSKLELENRWKDYFGKGR